MGEPSPSRTSLRQHGCCFGEAYSKGSHLFHVPLRPDMLASEDQRYRDLALSAMASPGRI